MPLLQNFKKLFISQDKLSPDLGKKAGKGTIGPSSVSSQKSVSPGSKDDTDSSSPFFSLNTPLDDLYPDLPSNYKLISVLGEGAFSIVYKAIDTNAPKDPIAIKVINKTNLTNKQVNNIKNEVNIMKKVSSHPNLLSLYNYFDTKKNCFLILEYCNGGEVFNKIIEYTYFSEDLSRHVFKQLLTAIEYLHLQNVVHRDIKPENLLFNTIPMMPRSKADFKKALRQSDDDSKVDEGIFIDCVGGGTIGQVKLADFGLAKQLPKLEIGAPGHSNLKTPCGTAGYTAPEVITCSGPSPGTSGGGKRKVFPNTISKHNYYSKAVDIWSLGCLLYTIICGFPPFYDEQSSELTSKILTANYEFLSPWWDEVSDDVKDLISKMLTVNPEERITIPEIWNHPWVKTNSASDSNYFVPNRYVVKSLPKKQKSTSHFTSFIEKRLANSETCDAKLDVPLRSPRAEAIRKVFDNPAMTEYSSLSDVSGVDAIAHIVAEKAEALSFIENIAEEYEAEHNSSGAKCAQQARNKVRINVIDESTSESSSSCAASKSSTEIEIKPKRKLPKTPNPLPLGEVNFKDVFNIKPQGNDDDDFDDSEEDDDGESETKDEVVSLSKVATSHSHGRLKHDELADTAEVSSLNSASEYDHDEDDIIRNDNDQDTTYQTRSSSIISGINGDFKFTLNMNDSNILSRRRSSTISRSLKKYSSNSSAQGVSPLASAGFSATNFQF